MIFWVMEFWELPKHHFFVTFTHKVCKLHPLSANFMIVFIPPPQPTATSIPSDHVMMLAEVTNPGHDPDHDPDGTALYRLWAALQ